MIKKLWNRLFLVERSSIGLSFFRMAVAFTVGSHVIPSFFQMADNYYSTAFKIYNMNFFPKWALLKVSQSPDWVVTVFVGIFLVSWIFFFFGLFSQISCIVLTVACYYFYALNSFHVGTLSWDILLVTMFLMCWTPYHGDYFSADCFNKGNPSAYKKRRPYFLQRLLQFQIGFTFFYTALYKVTAQGNWLTDNPIFYIMNYPVQGTAKFFILKDFLRNMPELCYWIGISVVVIEFLMIFLLFIHKTRVAAIYLGFVFHIVLMLTLDVPATFFFLFPAQLLLFINPDRVEEWIERRRVYNQSAKRPQLLYDGNCQFCLKSVERLKLLDLFATLEYVDLQKIDDFKAYHNELDRELVLSQMHLIETNGRLYGGFAVFKRICFQMPMIYPFIPVLYFPGMSFIGDFIYKFVAKNRYLFHRNPTCNNNSCFR